MQYLQFETPGFYGISACFMTILRLIDNGVQEAAGSNPVTRTKNLRFRNENGGFCFYFHFQKLDVFWLFRRVECEKAGEIHGYG